DIYGGTQRVKDKLLPTVAIESSEFDGHSIASLEAAIQPNTKMVIFETPTNPNLRVMDIRAIASVCKKHGLLCVIDNTFASPYVQNPLDLGCDIVIHSTTKYISGHSDIIGGALICNDPEIHHHVFEYSKTVGAVPSPFDCWLTLRGVKTLALRMERHCQNAAAIADFLSKNSRVKTTYYPGLASHPEHAIAKSQMSAFGGMVSFEVEGEAIHAKKIAESTRVFMLAESLGGVESIIGYPTLMSHGCMTEEERQAKDIRPTHLRLSVGIEDIEDLLEDLDQAISKAFIGTPERVLVSA
ncbi:MAG: PLP-dependent transferase, partial [Fimbriimonadaceae bacterium]